MCNTVWCFLDVGPSPSPAGLWWMVLISDGKIQSIIFSSEGILWNYRIKKKKSTWLMVITLSRVISNHCSWRAPETYQEIKSRGWITWGYHLMHKSRAPRCKWPQTDIKTKAIFLALTSRLVISVVSENNPFQDDVTRPDAKQRSLVTEANRFMIFMFYSLTVLSLWKGSSVVVIGVMSCVSNQQIRPESFKTIDESSRKSWYIKQSFWLAWRWRDVSRHDNCKFLFKWARGLGETPRF